MSTTTLAAPVSRLGSLQAVTAFLAGTGLLQTIAALQTSYVQQNAIGSFICLVAFLHYTWMRDASDAERVELRFSDWLVTTPALLLELHLLTEQTSRATLVVPVLAVLVMLGLGFGATRAATRGARAALFGGACVAFGVVAGSSLRHAQAEIGIAVAFFGVWSLYAVVAALVEWNASFDIAFDALDAISKAVFGTWVALKSLDELK